MGHGLFINSFLNLALDFCIGTLSLLFHLNARLQCRPCDILNVKRVKDFRSVNFIHP